MRRIVVATLAGLLLLSAGARAQTVGLFVNEEEAFEGYTLFGPHQSDSVFLLSNDGLVVHEWATGEEPRLMGYLLENGHLLRAVGGRRIQEFDWDGNLIWDYQPDPAYVRRHHDIEPMPNGNVLIIGHDVRTAAEAIAAGRDPLTVVTEIQPDMIVELRPIPPDDAEIVWEWRSWDHMIQDFDVTKTGFGVVADHPELIDINFGDPPTPDHPDIHHSNGIDYNAELDQIVLSVRMFSEFWVIDHSTTIAEAAGHSGGNSGKGGDLIYRWGNPEAYGRGTPADRRLFFQHDASWIPAGRPGAGNITVYNNGTGRPGGDFSSADEIVPPVDQNGIYSILPGAPFEPDQPVWSYISSPPTDFYSAFISGLERQPNGNTLICEGTSGHLFEVTSQGDVVWDYLNPVYTAGHATQGDPAPPLNNVFKVRRYAADYPGLAGRDLTPGDPLELFTAPLPVPNSSLTALRETDSGDQIRIDWDASTCTSFDYHLLYGDLAEVSSHELSGADCNVGFSGSHTWTSVPAQSLYFLLVGTDGTGVYESTWGTDSSGAPRNAYGASFLCGTTTKIVSSTCP